MLAWWVGIWLNLRPWRRWRSWSDLLSKHLLSADPAIITGLRKPRRNYFFCHIQVPNADQMVMESLIPHKASCMVWSVRHSSEQLGWFQSDNFSIFKDHSVSIHISYTSKHVAKRVFTSIHLVLSPAVCHRLFKEALNFILKLRCWRIVINKDIGEFPVKFSFCCF